MLLRSLKRPDVVQHILRRDFVATEDDEALHHVAKLPDVAGPVDILQSYERFLRDFFWCNAVLVANLVDEMFDQHLPGRRTSLQNDWCS